MAPCEVEEVCLRMRRQSISFPTAMQNRLEKNATAYWMIDYDSNRVGLFRKKSSGANRSPITSNVQANMSLTVLSAKFVKMSSNYRTLWNISWNKLIWIVTVNALSPANWRTTIDMSLSFRWFLRMWPCCDRCKVSAERTKILQWWSIWFVFWFHQRSSFHIHLDGHSLLVLSLRAWFIHHLLFQLLSIESSPSHRSWSLILKEKLETILIVFSFFF